MFNYKITCPHCKKSFIMYSCPQSLKDFEKEEIKGKCLHCHELFLMKDAASLINTSTDNQSNIITEKLQPLNYWRMIYRLMDNVKTAMDATAQDKQSNISMKDVQNIIQYINTSINNIMN